MYEFMNKAPMVITVTLIMITILLSFAELGRTYELKTKFRPFYPIYTAIIVSVALTIYDMKSTQILVLANKKLFDTNVEIQCATLTTSYLVSQNKGWRYLDKNHLSDGNIILDLQLCKPLGVE